MMETGDKVKKSGTSFAAANILKLPVSDRKTRIFLMGYALFFALCTRMGQSFENTASWGYFFASFRDFLVSAALTAVYALVYYYVLGYILYFADKAAQRTGGKTAFFERHVFAVLWVGLLIGWAFYLIVDYPAIVHYDSAVMLINYFENNINNHHPVVQTLVSGAFVTWVSDLTGSFELSVFLYAAIQYFYGSLIFAALFAKIYKRGCPLPVLAASYACTVLLPVYSRYAPTICKDVNYSFFIMLYLYFYLVLDENKQSPTVKTAVALFAAAMLTEAARKNGIHLVALSGFAFVIRFLRYKKAAVLVLLSTLAAIVGFLWLDHALTVRMGLLDHDVRESASLFFQQTARYARDCGDDITDGEKAVISRVLVYDTLAEEYDPERSDPVKDNYIDGASREEIADYMKVWAKCFARHPGCYIQATLNNIYGYFYPPNDGRYANEIFPQNDVFAFNVPGRLKDLADDLRELDLKIKQIPLLGLFFGAGIYIWAELFIAGLCLLRKKYGAFFFNVPALVSVLICIAGPVNNYTRYALPVIFIVPFALCLYFTDGGALKDSP